MTDKNKGTKPFANLFERPGFLMRRLHQIHVGMFMEECAAHDITPVQYGLLTVLDVNDSLDQVSLATDVGMDRTSGADVIRRLERRGLVKRLPDPTDRRAKRVAITAQGREIVEFLAPHMARAQTRFLAPLSEAEQTLFIQMTQKMIEANNEAGRAPLSPQWNVDGEDEEVK